MDGAVREADAAGVSQPAMAVPRLVPHQGAIGLGLAAAIIAAFLTVHVGAVHHLDVGRTPALATLGLAALQTWLSVGLFIIAHDAMHGSLAPFRPRLNRLVGRVALRLYAGFSYDRLIGEHFAHHRHAGTADDPDFDEDHADAFWPWFGRFLLTYMSWRELAQLTAYGVAAALLLGAPVVNLVVFWALPAIIAAVQLFYFGTYRPHRREDAPFADDHRARTDDFPPWLSLLTCFHFGYHYEHHLAPHLPWWRLPELHRLAARETAEAAS